MHMARWNTLWENKAPVWFVLEARRITCLNITDICWQIRQRFQQKFKSKIEHFSDRRYTAIFVTCKPPDARIPQAVSVAKEMCEATDNLLLVQDTRHRGSTQSEPHRHDPRYNFTVCVKPFNFNYNNTYQLVEFFEMSQILGADKFVFYNYRYFHSNSRFVNKLNTWQFVPLLKRSKNDFSILLLFTRSFNK